jgi:hypothetical protein
MHIKYIAIVICGATDLQLHAFLNSTLDADEWSASLSCHFILVPLDRISGGSRVGMDTVEKNKTLDHSGNRTMISVVRSLV